MIASLKPYPSMKESGVPWLGKVPDHWSVLPNRALFAEIKDRNHPDEEMLSVTITRGVVKQKELLADSTKKDSSNLDRSAYKLVQPRDIAYNKMRAWQGAIGASGYRGIISPAYVVMRLRGDANPRYFHHLYRTPQFAKEAERWSYGITSDMWSLRPEHFKLIYSLLPPREEQDEIVRFLDYADLRIRYYIRTKQNLIKTLEEQKSSIINRAVSRGLAANSGLKPANIEWLQQIPAHWTVSRVKALARKGAKTFTDGDWIEIPYITEEGVRLIQTGNVGVGEYREKGFRYVSPQTFYALKCTEVAVDDVLICRLDGPVGRACLAPNLGTRMITSVDNTILKVREGVNPRFLVQLMSSTLWLSWIGSICRAGGGFRYRISRSMLGNMTVPLPPLAEQQSIADLIDAESRSTLLATRRIREEISLIRDYHIRLNVDLITGKRDAREASKVLPAELPALVPETEPDEQLEPHQPNDELEFESADEEAEA